MEYTLEQFEKELKALFCKAVEAGHTVDDIGEIAENVLQGEWSSDN